MKRIMHELHRFTPFRCRVVLIDSYLSDDDYRKLLLATTYVLNASSGEGQCLPLMEYMSAGKPAVAPRHTALADYISVGNAFVVDTSVRPAAWPQDPRACIRTLARQIDMGSLQRAFHESYRVAKNDPGRYRAMSQCAREALKNYCAASATVERLLAIIQASPQVRLDDNSFGTVPSRNIDYVLGDEVNFSKHQDARRYLFSGWSFLELGFGVWSDGETAELAFRVDSLRSRPLELRAKVNTFVNSMNSEMTVIVSANERELTQWKFSQEGVHESQNVWRTAVIPEEIITNNYIYVRFDIKSPASPSSLGMSDDLRLLGIALQELYIDIRGKDVTRTDAAVAQPLGTAY
jgi:hypothetical protein